MAKEIKNKNLTNTRLANNYGGWVYCDACGENIGNLCYQTYDKINFKYTCNCGSCGSMEIDFADSVEGNLSEDELVTIKNRLCCPKDSEPLITILDKKLSVYDLEITCKACGSTYKKNK